MFFHDTQTPKPMGTYSIAVRNIPNFNSRRKALRKYVRSALSLPNGLTVFDRITSTLNSQQYIAESSVFPTPMATNVNNQSIQISEADHSGNLIQIWNQRFVILVAIFPPSHLSICLTVSSLIQRFWSSQILRFISFINLFIH